MAENELKFKKLSDVELIEEAPDSAHALAEIDGEIKRVAGGVGGGAGGYLVDATGEGALTSDDSSTLNLIVTTPVPGLAEALEKGSTVTIKGDIGLALGKEARGYYGYLLCSTASTYFDFIASQMESEEVIPTEGQEGYEEVELMKDVYACSASFVGDPVIVLLLNGHSMEELTSTSALSTAKMKLTGGGKIAE